MATAGSGDLLIPLLIGGASGAVQGATAPRPNPYTGDLAPQNTLQGVEDLLHQLYSGEASKLSQPVSLPDAVVGQRPTYSSPDLPFTFGGGDVGDLGHAPSLPGLDLPPIPPQPTSTPSPTSGPADTSGVNYSPAVPSGPHPGVPPNNVNTVGSAPPQPAAGSPAVHKIATGPVRQNFTGTNNAVPSAQPAPTASNPRDAAIQLLQEAIRGGGGPASVTM